MSKAELPEGLLQYDYAVFHMEVWCPSCGEANWVQSDRYPPDYSATGADAIKCWNCKSIMVCEDDDFVEFQLEDLKEGEDWRDHISWEDGKKEP